jgi:hypothetical protein
MRNRNAIMHASGAGFDVRSPVDAEQLNDQCTCIVQRALHDKDIPSDK